MGFLDIAKGIGKMVADDAVDFAQQRANWVEKYERMSDANLKREYESKSFNSSEARRSAFRQVCRERGFIKD